MPGLFVNLSGHPNVDGKVRKGQTTPAVADQGSKTIDSFENKKNITMQQRATVDQM